MNGAAVFNFTLNEVPASTNALLRRTNTTPDAGCGNSVSLFPGLKSGPES
jgi:hypothetical protein